MSANRTHLSEVPILKATGVRYAAFLCILLVLQACQPVDDTANDSPGISTDGVSTVQLVAPRILLDTRAVDIESLGVEVVVSYTIAGTNYQESGVATRSGAVWELDIAVPRNTPFEIRMTWFESRTPRLDLARITRTSTGFSESGQLSFSQDFSSAEGFSESTDSDNYHGFDDDDDDQTNLEELIAGTDPFVNNDLVIEEATQPTLSLQPTTFSLAASAGTAVNDSLTVANTGDLSLEYSIESDSEWLTVSPTGGQIAGGASENVQVSASCGSMAETRSGVLTFGGNGGSSTVSVSLTCEPPPPGPAVLTIVTTQLPLTATADSAASGVLTLENTGGQPLEYSIESDSEWLSVSPTGGQIAGGTSESVQVSASCGSTEETRSGALTIGGNGGSSTVSVLLTCELPPPGPAVLTIATTQLPLTATADSTASDVLTLENTGGQPLEYSIESDSEWLSVSPTSGQIARGTSENLQVNGNCGSLSEIRSGTLTVRSNGGNGTIAVQLTCSVGPSIDLPASLAVNLNASINETASNTIVIGNSGDAELSYLLSSDADWLTVSPQQGTIAAGETIEIQLLGTCGAGATELPATLSLESNGGNAEFAVSLRCTGGPALSDVSPASLQLATEISQVAQTSISFTNSGNDILDYTVQTDEGWLCLSDDDEQLCATGATTLSGQLVAGATNTTLVFATCADIPQTLTGLIRLSTNGGSDRNIPVALDCVQSASPSGLIVSASVNDSTGTFVTGIPPAAVGAITLTPFDDEALDTIISGGSIEIPVIADQPFSRLYVVTEPEGYFDIMLQETVSNASLILTANTELADVTEASITVQAETPVGSVSEGETVTVSTLEVLTGDLQVNVSWDQDTDVDLYLTTPSGDVIYYGNDVVGDGVLDLDSNAFCTSGPRNENISFGESDAPPGQYSIGLRYFSACGVESATQYVVTVRANGTTETYTGSFVPGDVGEPVRNITNIEIR